jgi:hypothetical protein
MPALEAPLPGDFVGLSYGEQLDDVARRELGRLVTALEAAESSTRASR